MTKTLDEWRGMVEQKVTDIDKKLDELIHKFDCLDDRYASKMTERLVYGFMGTVIAGLLGLFIYLIEKHII